MQLAQPESRAPSGLDHPRMHTGRTQPRLWCIGCTTESKRAREAVDTSHAGHCDHAAPVHLRRRKRLSSSVNTMLTTKLVTQGKYTVVCLRFHTRSPGKR